jgi:hypothetical protein
MTNQFITELIQSETLVDVYRDEIKAETLRGIIRECSDDLMCIEKYSDYGAYDGTSIVERPHVNRVRWGSRELGGTEKLLQKIAGPKKIDLNRFASLWDAIVDLNGKYDSLSLHIERIDPDICLIGKVIDFDEEFVLLDEFGTLRTQDKRKLLLTRAEITRVDVDGPYERDIAALMSR